MLIYFSKNIKTAYDSSPDGILKQCHECLRYKNNGRWTEQPPLGVNLEAVREENRLSYVVCEDCYPAYWEGLLKKNDEYNRTHGNQR